MAEEILKIGNGNPYEARVFKYSELVSATGNFKEESLIGEGGFGRVYKGYLDDTKQVTSFVMLFFDVRVELNFRYLVQTLVKEL